MIQSLNQCHSFFFATTEITSQRQHYCLSSHSSLIHTTAWVKLGYLFFLSLLLYQTWNPLSLYIFINTNVHNLSYFVAPNKHDSQTRMIVCPVFLLLSFCFAFSVSPKNTAGWEGCIYFVFSYEVCACICIAFNFHLVPYFHRFEFSLPFVKT